MSTSSLIQKLYGVDELNQSPSVGAENITASNRRKIERFQVAPSVVAATTLTIAAGDLVSIDYANLAGGEAVMQVIKSAATKGTNIVGVALTGGTSVSDAAGDPQSADFIDVVVGGICEAAVEGKNQAGNIGINPGDWLVASNVTGKFYKFTIGQEETPQAIAIDTVATSTSVTATVCLLPQWF